MAEFEKVLKDVVLGSVGAVATVVEKGGEIARALVEKGHEKVQNNQESVDQIRRKVRGVCDTVAGECRKAMQDEVALEGFSMQRTDDGLQLTCPMEAITPEKAEAMRVLLDQAEAQEQDDGRPLLMRLDGMCPGVYVTINAAMLPKEKRDRIRALLDELADEQG